MDLETRLASIEKKFDKVQDVLLTLEMELDAVLHDYGLTEDSIEVMEGLNDEICDISLRFQRYADWYSEVYAGGTIEEEEEEEEEDDE